MIEYVVGGIAKGKLFYGRERESGGILRQRRTWVCGQRRIGKSSLLHHVKKLVRDNEWIPLLIDLSMVPESETSPEELYDMILDEIQMSLPEQHDFPNFDGESPGRSFADLFDVPLDANPDKRVFLLIDEAERLINVDDRENGFLDELHVWLSEKDGLYIVMAASQTLSVLFRRSGKELIKSFYFLALSGLTEQAGKDLICCKQASDPLNVSEEILAEAVNWTGGHPRMLQELGQRLSDWVIDGKRPIDRGLLAECYEDIAEVEALKSIFDDDFSRLSRAQQAVLAASCEAGGKTLTCDQLAGDVGLPQAQVHEAAKFLAKYGYVNRQNCGVALRFGFYPRFLPTGIDSFTDAEDLKEIDLRDESEDTGIPASDDRAGDPSAKPMRMEETRVSPPPKGHPIKVFISYTHKDESLVDRLRDHLKILETEGVIGGWYDRNISAGADWEEEIDEHLNEASIILLAVSARFLASKYCRCIEVRRALERHEQGEARVIPVILRPVDWGRTSFSKLQGLPKDARPVVNWKIRDEAYLDIERGVRKVAEELMAKS